MHRLSRTRSVQHYLPPVPPVTPLYLSIQLSLIALCSAALFIAVRWRIRLRRLSRTRSVQHFLRLCSLSLPSTPLHFSILVVSNRSTINTLCYF